MAERNGTRTSAERHARMIREYWAGRGFSIRTEIVPLGKIEGKTEDGGYVVRSDMINGKPAKPAKPAMTKAT